MSASTTSYKVPPSPLPRPALLPSRGRAWPCDQAKLRVPRLALQVGSPTSGRTGGPGSIGVEVLEGTAEAANGTGVCQSGRSVGQTCDCQARRMQKLKTRF